MSEIAIGMCVRALPVLSKGITACETRTNAEFPEQFTIGNLRLP